VIVPFERVSDEAVQVERVGDGGVVSPAFRDVQVADALERGLDD
jgi:hypothetical protein